MKLELKVWGCTDEVIFFSMQPLYLRSFITYVNQLYALISQHGPENLMEIQSLKHLSVFTFSSRLKRHLKNLKSDTLFL